MTTCRHIAYFLLSVSLSTWAAHAIAQDKLRTAEEFCRFRDSVGVFTKNPPDEWPEVELESTVTYVDPLWNFAFLQDGDNAIFIAGLNTSHLTVGSRVRVFGQTASGDLLPFVEVAHTQILAKDAEIPDPKPIRIEDNEYGENDGRLVEVEGRVMQTFCEPHRTTLYCQQGDTHFFVSIAGWGYPAAPETDVQPGASFIGRRIRASGNLGVHVESHAFAQPGDHTESLRGFRLFCPRYSDVEILDPVQERTDLPQSDASVSNIQSLLDHDLKTKRFIVHGLISEVETIGGQEQVVAIDEHAALRFSVASRIGIYRGMILRMSGERSNNPAAPYHCDYLQLLGHSGTLPSLTPTEIAVIENEGKIDHRYRVVGTPVKTLTRNRDKILLLSDGQNEIEIKLYGEAQSLLNQVAPNIAKTVSACGILVRKEDTAMDGRTRVQLLASHINDLKMVEKRASPTQLLFILGGLSGAVFLWGWLLRRQVSRKTQDLRELAAQLQSSYEAIEDGILAIDANGAVLTINQECRRILDTQVAVGDSVAGLPEVFAKKLADRSTFLQTWLNSIENPKGCYSLSVTGNDSDCTSIAISTSPIKVPDTSKPIGRLWVFRDETDKKKLQAELTRANKLEAVGRLAGGVAHDFNNILAAITSNLNVAQLDPQATVDSVNEELSLAKEAAYRGADVSRRLLTFSSELNLKLEPQSINQLIERLVQFIKHSFDASVEFRLDLDASDPVVNVERAAIEQVLVNLYVNAKDAMKDGGCIYTKTSIIRSGSESLVRIAVRDTGEGIPVEVRDRIFDPFFSTKGPQKGTGLGLSTSYRVVERHHGQLQLAGETTSHGTEFWIDLPLSKAKPKIPREKALCESQHGRILIVDDEDSVRVAAAKLLQSKGFDILQAANGNEALEILAAHHTEIDQVLLDLTMPGMPGKDVLAKIKSRWPSLSVLVCSGYVVSDALADLPIQPDAVIAKPYSLHELLQTVQANLDGSAPPNESSNSISPL